MYAKNSGLLAARTKEAASISCLRESEEEKHLRRISRQMQGKKKLREKKGKRDKGRHTNYEVYVKNEGVTLSIHKSCKERAQGGGKIGIINAGNQ